MPARLSRRHATLVECRDLLAFREPHSAPARLQHDYFRFGGVRQDLPQDLVVREES
jgi:NADH:ubiquinone oxidoreductase subunit D